MIEIIFGAAAAGSFDLYSLHPTSTQGAAATALIYLRTQRVYIFLQHLASVLNISRDGDECRWAEERETVANAQSGEYKFPSMAIGISCRIGK